MGIRKRTRGAYGLRIVVFGLVLLGLCLFFSPTYAADRKGSGPCVILSQEFFSAMQKLAEAEAGYGDRQEPLLRQIALSSRYLVQTNFTLIQQNERIIRLLEELNRKHVTKER